MDTIMVKWWNPKQLEPSSHKKAGEAQERKKERKKEEERKKEKNNDFNGHWLRQWGLSVSQWLRVWESVERSCQLI